VDNLPGAAYEPLKKKWETLEKLDFPQSPGEPYLDNLYLELADYTVFVSTIAATILDEGLKPDKEQIEINQDWNNRLENFKPDSEVYNLVCSSMKEYKQVLDEILDLILKT
jgi:hypothetical protein